MNETRYSQNKLYIPSSGNAVILCLSLESSKTPQTIFNLIFCVSTALMVGKLFLDFHGTVEL